MLSEVAASSMLRLRHFIRHRKTKRPVGCPTGGQYTSACPEVSVVDPQLPRSKQTDSTLSPTQSRTPLEGITELLENIPNKSCVELTRRLLSTVCSLPTREARPRSVLKTVIPFTAECCCTTSDYRGISVAAGLLER
jgi:hypothetical protein